MSDLLADARLLNQLALVWMAVAVATLVLLRFVSAPYGRHVRKGWGPAIPNRLAWVLMETLSPTLILLLCITGRAASIAQCAFLCLWLAHYIYRAFVYPLRLAPGQPMPLSVVLLGMCFNLVNATLNGGYLFHATRTPDAWLLSPQFVIGVALFIIGSVINRRADRTLRELRRTPRAPDEPRYAIPTGGLYRWVSCPNYLGEIIEWVGWAVATWSLPGLSFAVWTFANLAPRALLHHRWYRKFFPNYPKERRALIPGIL